MFDKWVNQYLEYILFARGLNTVIMYTDLYSPIKLPTSSGSSKKQESSRKTSISALLTMPKAFDCVDHNKRWKILKEMGVANHLTCLLRNVYAGQEATVRTGHGTTDWFQIGKGGLWGCILSPCLFNFNTEYIMRNAGLGISTSWNQDCWEKHQ